MPQRKKAVQESTEPKQSFIAKFISKFLVSIKFPVYIVGILSIISCISLWVSEVRESQAQERISLESDVFSIPRASLPPPLATFRFPGSREGEDREFVVKLGGAALVKLSLYLAYDPENEVLGEELQQRRYQLQDAIQYFISTKSVQDMDTVDKQHNFIKKELLGTVNSLLTYGKVQDIYFTQFYILPQ